MVTLLRKDKCSGCGACENICPNNSITMTVDEEGFLYPKIDTSTCIECNICDRVCPVMGAKKVRLDIIPNVFLSWSNNLEQKEQATSGGLFYALATRFLRDGGYVVGATYYDVYKVHHVIVRTEEKLKEICRSKYVQSEMGFIYYEVMNLLNKGEKVLFSGTGCQVYGLLSYLKLKNVSTEFLYTVDVVCHGVPSPLVLEKYIKYMEKKHNSKVKELRMREKVHDLKYITDSKILLIFEDDSMYTEFANVDYYGSFFWGEIASRPSCYDCSFKTVGRISDLTIGDCWFSRELSSKSTPYDVTLSLVHSNKGLELMKSDSINSVQVDAIASIKSNGGMIYSSVNPHPNRSEFFENIERGEEIDTLAKKYFPASSSELRVLLRRLKRVFKMLPIFRLFAEKKYHRDKEREFIRRCSREIPSESMMNTVL